eukprot:CAMPEP_0170354386 /NCGR_PEP_ID=MMETSP0117_2-20130122/75_1 /TAXON_ID=400756 /ORGANISM="Durinskia baltica, Strain CSIRO CS-38" /LENGTH=231 /DNA_ID=CAMNT_0010608341 /DNA_START=30 /DNA_END=726 /DNA_ORIENTATION=-
MFLAYLLIVCIVATVVFWDGMYGWDTSGVEQQAIIDCLKDTNDAQFITFTGMYYNDVSEEICGELSMSAKSNISKRDIKFSPCPTCTASAESQLNKLVSYVNSTCAANTWSGRVWLDMNSYSFWPAPWRDAGYIANQKWYNEMVDACLGMSAVECGCVLLSHNYKYIVGSTTYTYAPATSLPLWYSSTNGEANFDDFTAFGGFTKPYAKQFLYMLNECGGSVVYQDWAPAW